jgi:hypothetical protein
MPKATLGRHWNQPRPSEPSEVLLVLIPDLLVFIRFAKPEAYSRRHWNQRHPLDA